MPTAGPRPAPVAPDADPGSIPGRRLRLAVSQIGELTRGRAATGVSHDADELGGVGTIASYDAIGFDPMPVLEALAQHGAPAAVIGQVAGILHGSAELTGDLDLLWSGEPGDAERMAAAFIELGADLFDEEHASVADPTTAFALPKVLFRTATAAGDCCTPRLPWRGLDVAAFLDRADSTEIDGVVVRYVALDDLNAMRRISARPKDLRRLAELERLAGPSSPSQDRTPPT